MDIIKEYFESIGSMANVKEIVEFDLKEMPDLICRRLDKFVKECALPSSPPS